MRAWLNVNTIPSSGKRVSEITGVFAHGFGCDQRMWYGVVDRLPDWRRILFDWPGAGMSDPRSYDPNRHASLAGYADDLLAMLEALDLRDVVLVGHSVAASIAAIAAVKDSSRLHRIVMLAPSPCFRNDAPYLGGFDEEQLMELLSHMDEGLEAWAQSVGPLIMGNSDRPDLSEMLVYSFCTMDPSIAMRWARATFFSDIRHLIPLVKTPCLLMQAADDILASPYVGHWLNRNLRSSRLVQLQARGHCPHVSSPEEVVTAIQLNEDFLSVSSWQSSSGWGASS